MPGDCYLYRATVKREAVAAAVAGLAMSVAGNGLLDACPKGDRHREDLLRALLSGMRAAATCEDPMDSRRLATGQRFQHVTTKGRQCTVAVLLVQERMDGEPDAVLEWSGTERREKMRLSLAQRILRDSVLLP